MATTVRFAEGEITKIEKGFVRAIGMDLWYRSSPFWYKHNQHGTWEVYTTEEMDIMIDKGYYPKLHTQLMKEMVNSVWRIR